MWSLFGSRSRGSRKTPSFHWGDDSEGKVNLQGSWAFSERKEELMKEAAKGWQVWNGRRNESVNSNLPSAFVIDKTVRWHLRLSSSGGHKQIELLQASVVGAWLTWAVIYLQLSWWSMVWQLALYMKNFLGLFGKLKNDVQRVVASAKAGPLAESEPYPEQIHTFDFGVCSKVSWPKGLAYTNQMHKLSLQSCLTL